MDENENAVVGNLNEDIDRMKTTWLNEMNAPDILVYNEDIISEMLQQIQNQQEYVNSVNDDRENLTEERAFVSKLYQMEIERLRYIVTSYLRLRLQKIEKYAMYIIKQDEIMDRLSSQEKQFLQNYIMLYENHVKLLALNQFPQEHQQLNNDEMICQPNLDSFVFCESKVDLGELQCDDHGAEFISMQQNDRLVLRYRVIKNFITEDRITLI